VRREVWSTSRSCFQNEAGLHTRCQFPNDAGLDTRCKFPDDAGLHTSQVESSAVRVLVALVKAERKRAAALENVAKFRRSEKSNQMLSSPKPKKRWKKPEIS